MVLPHNIRQLTVNSQYSFRVGKVVLYSVANPHRIFLRGGDGVFIALSKVFSVMTTFQSAGLVVGKGFL
jgi:hypothetical protein